MTAREMQRAIVGRLTPPAPPAPPEPLAPHDELAPPGQADTQAEGLRVLLAIAVSPPEERREYDDVALPDGPPAQVARLLDPVADPPLLALPEPEPELADETQPRSGRRITRTAPAGRHAAAPPPYLDRPGVRFLLFSAIGGFVFLLGIGLQAAMTGEWHVSPVISYLVQAVVSVETSLLLNRWLTWRDRTTPFWLAFARFNAQKTVTIALNLALYAGLLHLGMNYLVANVVLTAMFTVVNYVAGDRLVFIPGRIRRSQPAAPAVPAPSKPSARPSVSVVIPCRGNERTIADAVQSLLKQDYPGLREIVLIGSPGDSTWDGLEGITHSSLTMWEVESPPGVRDANYKRDTAVRMTSGDLIALVDSDIMLPRNWLSSAVQALEDSDASCVAGGMKSYHDSFWGHYTDGTWIGAKTPRITGSYTVTSANFGARGRKPPILANTLFTRDLYEHCPIDPMWSHGSYEDYEWFWRAVKAGNTILVCRDLFGWHHHRQGLRALTREYRRSARGCAYFIRAHPESPLARRRRRQATWLPLAAIATAGGLAAASAVGYGLAVAGLFLGSAAVLTVHQVARSRSLESLAYPPVGIWLGMVFTSGLVTNLIRSRHATFGRDDPAGASDPSSAGRGGVPARRFLPVFAICAVQAMLSLTLVWSNTAYVDEADNLWIGRLEIAHWLHKSPLPPADAFRALSGSSLLYPPLGALANSAGGLAGARILSLVLMLAATVLLYLAASRLIGRTGALFAAALWAFSEPALRLAFATADPLSMFFVALAAWLIVQALHQRRVGELVAAAAIALALANVTMYASIFIDPVVVVFAFLAWRIRGQVPHPLSRAAWLAATWALFLGLIMTASHSWPLFSASLSLHRAAGSESASAALNGIWGYGGLVLGLAAVGAILSVQAHNRSNTARLGSLCVVAYLLLQLSNQTPETLDRHLAYAIWFAAFAAGHACARFIHWVPAHRQSLIALCCGAALIYPVATSWQSSWQRYHAWPNAAAFISSLGPVVASDQGVIYVPRHETNIAEYYTTQSHDSSDWNGSLSLDPVTVPTKSWAAYYARQLAADNYGVIVLFYSTTFSSSTSLPANILLSKAKPQTYDALLGIVGANSGARGLQALTEVLETDPSYTPVAEGPYNTSNISGTHNYGVYAIWQRVAE